LARQKAQLPRGHRKFNVVAIDPGGLDLSAFITLYAWMECWHTGLAASQGNSRDFSGSERLAGVGAMNDQSQHRFEFGPFCLDESQHLLTREGRSISLPPKCFGLLCVMVKNRGQLLEKSRLMHELWPDTFVEEANLSNTVALLRKALGDPVETAQYIQTIPRLGYRFLAPVRAPLSADGDEVRMSNGHRPPIRVLVFPFRSVDSEHFAYSLPEAISDALAELNAFTVRSMQVAMRFDPLRWDPATVAREADVDMILCGTVERLSARIHAVTQLIEAKSGTVLWSKSWDVEATDLFQFHRGVVQLILRTLPHGAPDMTPSPLPGNAPATPEAYELYLRANQLIVKRSPESFAVARDLYIACLEKDPNYAPAWARLGRCYRFLEKFGGGTANRRAALCAIEKAFSLNPDLGIAHNVYTPIQADMGQAESAMVRLLQRAGTHDNDPELFTGLVQACRYCGQLDASLAAHRRAIGLDPNVRTSVAHTFFLKADFERALYWYGPGPGVYLDVLALASMGREQEAAALLWTRKDVFHLAPEAMNSLHAYLEKDYARCIAILEQTDTPEFYDREFGYYRARQAVRGGALDLANRLLLRSINDGYWSTTSLSLDPWLEPLRATSQFKSIFDLAKSREEHSRVAFIEAGGESVLAGYSVAASES
jgi:DNA-binding winged helix-turn-helix (wHTH) protein/tetratricopeptide (TPR) repeat protein